MTNFRHIGTDFTNGARIPHYANGRLLTAEDLQQDQQANLGRITQAGRAVGQGIVEGFNVSAVLNDRSLRVTAGLGINGKGDAVQLQAESVELPIQPVADAPSPLRRSGRFGPCDQADGENPAAQLRGGAYLLTVAPVARLEGAAPRQSSSGTETATCANQWAIEGVEFKIIRLVNYQTPVESRRNRNRNLLAHWFYGSQKLNTLMRDPFQFDPAYTGFDEISTADLTPCDLPLAVFFWQNNQIRFVDEWAARRRLYQPYPGTAWKANLSDQRKAEGEARFLQFQDHIADLQQSSSITTSSIQMADRFAHLPPFGFLPVNPFELIVRDIFDVALNPNFEGMINQRELTTEQVFQRVRTGLLTNFGNDNIFSLESFFGDLLPNQYQIVHEDVLHTQLQHAWVQPAIQVPLPSMPGSPTFPVFELGQADGSMISVDQSNLPNVFLGITSTFSTLNIAEIGALINPLPATTTNDFTIGTNSPIANDPLIDILVTNESIAPYQQELTVSMMSDLINAAIESLSRGGGDFSGSSDLTDVSARIRKRLIAQSFIASATSIGVGNFSDLRVLDKTTKPPVFYVAFVRHRPDAIRRTLRASEADSQVG